MTPLILIPKPDWSLSLIIQESIAKDHFCCFSYGWLIYMYEKVIELVKAHEKDMTDDELQGIAFLCECIVQERDLTRHRDYNRELLQYFYTGK